MGRYEDLMKMMKPEVSAVDAETKADNPRNWLADKVNPALDEYINPHMPDSFKLNIPEMTVADEKNFQSELPETMAGAAMGSIKTIPSAKFGNIHQILPEGDTAKAISGSEVSSRLQSLFGDKLAAAKAKVKSGDMAPSAYDIEKQGYLNGIRSGKY